MNKKEIIRKYKFQVIDLIEKLHAIMMNYCIRDDLENVTEIKICSDVNFRRLKKLFLFLFKENNYLNGVNIIQRKGGERISEAHNVALRTFRKEKFASRIINKVTIESKLFKFKNNVGVRIKGCNP